MQLFAQIGVSNTDAREQPEADKGGAGNGAESRAES